MLQTSGNLGASKKTLLTFVVGLVVGFVLTYILVSSFSSGADRRPGINSHSQSFIPDSPHSHGETDHFSGPDKEQIWEDFHAENHKDEDAVAQELSSRVRVLCWVMTSPGTLVSKARHVKATWGKRCNTLLFMSSQNESTLPAVGLPVSEGRDNLWGKTKEAFKYIYQHHIDSADWFMKADDDTYVVVENLRKLLKDLDPQKPLYLGRRFKPFVRQGYMSGGAGYVLSKEAVRRFTQEAIPDGRKCRVDPGGAEDVEMGKCLDNVGVRVQDSRDVLGRETFHPFIPEHHLTPGLVPKDNWYWIYNYYPARQGPECCSDYAVTFHYVPPNMMYVFEYFVYHLKPYGISSKLVLPSDKDWMATTTSPKLDILRTVNQATVNTTPVRQERAPTNLDEKVVKMEHRRRGGNDEKWEIGHHDSERQSYHQTHVDDHVKTPGRTRVKLMPRRVGPGVK